jgi:hypothetical protein
MIDLFLMDQKKFIHLIKFPEKHSMAEQEWQVAVDIYHKMTLLHAWE